jgi:hypothetical protein
MRYVLLEKPEYKVFILITPILLMYGCEQNQRYNRLEQLEIRSSEQACRTVKDINISDGVDQEEAETLAHVYFWRFSPTGGGSGVFQPVDMQNYWNAPVVFGYAGQPWGSIKIDKKTARMSWEHGPVVEDPVKYFCSKCNK